MPIHVSVSRPPCDFLPETSCLWRRMAWSHCVPICPSLLMRLAAPSGSLTHHAALYLGLMACCSHSGIHSIFIFTITSSFFHCTFTFMKKECKELKEGLTWTVPYIVTHAQVLELAGMILSFRSTSCYVGRLNCSNSLNLFLPMNNSNNQNRIALLLIAILHTIVGEWEEKMSLMTCLKKA